MNGVWLLLQVLKNKASNPAVAPRIKTAGFKSIVMPALLLDAFWTRIKSIRHP
jgi:hypothetical protein